MSQIGIHTPSPKATLDITAKTSDGSRPEGAILPRLTGDQIRSADDQYGADHVGTLIYATSATTYKDYDGKTEYIDVPGYYSFDGIKWLKIKENSWNIQGNLKTDSNIHFIGTKDDKDVIIKRNDFVSGIIGSNITSFGYQSMKTDVDPGSQNVAFGHGVLRNLTSGGFNTGVGSAALHYTTTGQSNVGIGTSALRDNDTGDRNVAVGSRAMISNTSGAANVGIGELSLWSNEYGSGNVGIGSETLKENKTGNSNVAIGELAGNKSTGSNNTFIGSYAGLGLTGGGNVMIGFYAGAFSEELNDRLIIANSNTNSPLIEGNFAEETLKTNGSFEINSGTKNGGIKITDGTQGEGKVLTSNADGLGTWQYPKTSVKTVTGSYTIISDDDNGFVFVNSDSNIIITVPAGLPAGFNCEIIQKGIGQVEIQGDSVAINSSQGLKTRTKYSVMKIILETATNGIATGDLVH